MRWLGRMAYAPALELQRQAHAAVVAGDPEQLLLVEHEPVFTAGRRTEPADRPVPGWPPGRADAPTVEVDRGGRITWHGPGQLTGYPIVRLPRLDVVAHVRRLESLLMEVCAELGLATDRVEGRSGVWVRRPGRPDAKVAAIGVRVARDVTMHGFALNANCNLSWFDAIVACGLPDATVTSLSAELGRDVAVEEIRALVEQRAGQLSAAVTA